MIRAHIKNINLICILENANFLFHIDKFINNS